MRRKVNRLFIGHETEVIVTMRLLRITPRVNDIHLCSHLIAGPKPGRSDESQKIIAVIVNESVRVANREFFLHVPDTIVRARLGVVIAFGFATCVLFVDDLPKGF